MNPWRITVALIAVWTVLAAGTRVAAQADVAIQRVVYSAAGLQATWSVSSTRLDQQPVWHPQAGDVPCSATSATQKALSRVRAQFPKIKTWVIREIVLKNIQKGVGKVRERNYPDRWFYSVEIVPERERDTELLSKREHLLVTVVLLDGSVVEAIFGPMYDAQ